MSIIHDYTYLKSATLCFKRRVLFYKELKIKKYVYN